MNELKLKSITVKNYRSFWEEQVFEFPKKYDKPIAIIWYNNSWKTNLMNAIRYWFYEAIREDTFELKDFHNLKWNNSPYFELEYIEYKPNISNPSITFPANSTITSKIILDDSLTSILKIDTDSTWMSKWDLKKNITIFYINFHNIKEEISTKKSNWWSLKSFLGKHIQKLVTEDNVMKARKQDFSNAVNEASKYVLEWNETEENEAKKWKSKLLEFIEKIKSNYNQNLRDNNIEIDFWLPNYEDIFLQMMFKIWLNGSKTNLVPIDHFWDGYISMFVMAVIQAIAEENDDKCLFLFEEPESFLHENHQEYFYKMVLCSLTKKWHQVIYTTHSDKMIDIFDTKWLIRLELEEYDDNWEKCFQTVKKYNKVSEFNPEIQAITEDEEIVTMDKYNEFIKTIEPNLNRILFSKKVLLVEWPNDILVYKYCIEKIIEEKIQHRTDIVDKKRFAETYLNFHNISIIPHHWKATAIYLIELCKWFWLDYFIINDWDFETDFKDKINLDFDSLKSDTIWSNIKSEKNTKNEERTEKTIKAMITTNKNLINSAWENNYHFNTPKLEKVIWYDFNDKSSVKIHNHITDSSFDYKKQDLFPEKLINFLEIDKIRETI